MNLLSRIGLHIRGAKTKWHWAKAYATQGRNQTLAQVANLPHICL